MLRATLYIAFSTILVAAVPPKQVDNLDVLISDIFSIPQNRVEQNSQPTSTYPNNNQIGHLGDVNPPRYPNNNGNTNVNPPTYPNNSGNTNVNPPTYPNNNGNTNVNPPTNPYNNGNPNLNPPKYPNNNGHANVNPTTYPNNNGNTNVNPPTYPNNNGNTNVNSPPNNGHNNNYNNNNNVNPNQGTNINYNGNSNGHMDSGEANPCSIGECTPYYLCTNGTIITDGAGILDVRFGEEDNPAPVLHPCKGLFQTCCSERSEKPIIPPIVKKAGCGHRNVEGVGFRISVRDNEAQFAEFPWTVAIMKEEAVFQGATQEILNVYQCGGTLIHPSVVLTAAHCVYGKETKSLKIRAGEWDTQTQDEIFPHQDRYVSEVVIHEQYYKGGLFNDVALVYLMSPVDLVENVNTACLPPQGEIFDGSRCFASGWGKDLWGKEGKYQVILKKIDLPIIPREPCVNALRHTRLGHRFQLHKSFICAGGEAGKDTCKGDGGSPLVCPIYGRQNQFYHVGIVAWGIGCGDVTPGVYVNVAGFRYWIDEQFDYKHLDKSYYIA